MANLPQTITAQVIHGDQIGRTVGFPTANLDISNQELTLEQGVYAGICEVDCQEYKCLPYYGPRHIFGEEKLSFEVFILGFDQDIYDQTISVKVLEYLRSPQSMPSLEALKKQLQLDAQNAQKFFNQTIKDKTDTL